MSARKQPWNAYSEERHDQETRLGGSVLDGKVVGRSFIHCNQVGVVVLGSLGERGMQVATKKELAIRPLYEYGHYCKVCKRVTLHRYVGPQRDRNGKVVLHLWNCQECDDTISMESPEECAKRWFRNQTRRMRQRRSKRRYG